MDLSKKICVQVFIGEGTLISRVSTPTGPDGVQVSGDSVTTTLIKLHEADEDTEPALPATWLLALHSGTLSNAHERICVAGFTLDGKFIVADSPLVCRPSDEKGAGLLCDGCSNIRNESAVDAKEAASRLLPLLETKRRRLHVPIEPAIGATASNTVTYATGVKRVLGIVICPIDSPNCATSSYPYGFCVGVIQTGITTSGWFHKVIFKAV